MSDTFERFKQVASRNLARDPELYSLSHAAHGVTSEAGEFAQVVRKAQYEREPHMTVAWTQTRATEELSDLMAYCAYAAEYLNVSMDTLLGLYLEKRKTRASRPPTSEG